MWRHFRHGDSIEGARWERPELSGGLAVWQRDWAAFVGGSKDVGLPTVLEGLAGPMWCPMAATGAWWLDPLLVGVHGTRFSISLPRDSSKNQM